MPETEESRALVKDFSDRSRKAVRVGRHFYVPHKLDPQGNPLEEETFNPRRDISRLSLEDFRYLAKVREAKWSHEDACEALGLDPAKVSKRCKSIAAYFRFEDAKCRELAAQLSTDFVAAKNMEGFYQDNLSDGQREHLKELAKITGAYKQTTVGLTANIWNVTLSPEQEKELKALGDKFADAVTAEVAA